jgi:hypothetical protein
LLGEEARADQLIEWSTKGTPGQRWVKDFPFGLRLGFVRDGDNPKVYIHWNQSKFNRFLEELGTQERFLIVSYGISVQRRHKHTLVKLLGAGRTSQVLWDSEHNEFSRKQEHQDVNWVVGMLRLAYDGPLFYTTPETKAELEESTAVAIIADKPKAAPAPKTAGELIAPQPQTQLSDRTRAYLLQSVLTDASLVTKS